MIDSVVSAQAMGGATFHRHLTHIQMLWEKSYYEVLYLPRGIGRGMCHGIQMDEVELRLPQDSVEQLLNFRR